MVQALFRGIQITQCKMFVTHCTLHIKQWPIQNVHYTLHITHCTMRIEHNTLHKAHYTLHNAKCSLHIAQCTLHNAHDTLDIAQCCSKVSQKSNKCRIWLQIKNSVLPVRIELTTPGLRDQCSTTELKRLCDTVGYVTKISKINLSTWR